MPNRDDEILLQIEEKVRALANSALANGQSLLLSALGNDLGEDLRKLKIYTRGGLSRFIQDRLSNEFAIVLGGEYRNVQAIVRAGPNGPSQRGTLEDLPRAKVSSPRYHYKFWAAFAVPLAAGKTRLIDLSSFNFEDVEPAEDRPGWKRINEELIAPTEIPDRDSVIFKNIDLWLNSVGETQSRFLSPTRYQTERTSRPFETGTLLDVLIQSLDAKQLSSTTMSLDAVSALLKKRI
jgi:hypothetical protein